MKKLLLITTILISINCFSQSKFGKEFLEADSDFYQKFEFSKQSEWLRINQDTSKVKIVGSELITIKLLIKYKSECFNDSCQVDVYVDPNKKTEIAPGVYSTTLMMGYYIKVWKHKEPTFSDFLDWLSKEYGL